LSSEALKAFEAYDWPGNVYELERTVARLAVMSEESVITLKDVRAHAAKLASAYSEAEAAAPVTSAGWVESDEARRAGRLARLDMRVVRLARSLIREDFNELKRFHPGLQNALEYVARNLHDVISLHDLARQAGLSASHLSYLFQKGLGVSFKSFLAIIRIEEAKQLLVEKPHMRITEISFQVGFGDLSHFERMFKRLVGQPPREYRSLTLGPEETRHSS
jgi:AraC-like DNA-binding protein